MRRITSPNQEFEAQKVHWRVESNMIVINNEQSDIEYCDLSPASLLLVVITNTSPKIPSFLGKYRRFWQSSLYGGWF